MSRQNNRNQSPIVDRDVDHPFESVERDETNLVTRNVVDILDAPRMFGEKTLGSAATPIVLVPSRGCCSFTISIPHGCAAIMTRYGKFLAIYKPGFYCLPPWYNVQYLVNTQHIPYHFAIRECPTRDDVKIRIHVDILLQVFDPQAFVYDIGPEKLEELLRASQAESVRSLVRSKKVAEAYDLRGSESDDMVNSLNDKLSAFGVKVEQVTIANVILPGGIANNMQSETTFESLQTEQRKKQEYELKVLNDNNYALRVKLDRENERKKAVEEAKRQTALITIEIQTLEAQRQRVLQEIEASEKAEVSKLEAEARNEVMKIQAEKERILMEVVAKRDAEVNRIRAETEKYERELIAQTKVIVTENKSKAVELLGEAELKASDKLKAKRQFDVELGNVQLWKTLGQNSNVLISPENQTNNAFSQFFAFNQMQALTSGSSTQRKGGNA